MRTPVSAVRPAPAMAASCQDFIDIVGESGRAYRFSRFRAGHPLSPVGGTYVLAREADGALHLVHIGAAESLLHEAGRLFAEAVEGFRASQLYSRLTVSGRWRECELADILAAQQPARRTAIAA